MKYMLTIGAGLLLSSAAASQDMTNAATLATNGYPACSASVTDSCIQLYERGVRASLDMDGNAVAMGGPYEPVETHADAMTDDHAAMGGPLEAVNYPPCSPGPGDDSCIQLYERGVTGN